MKTYMNINNVRYEVVSDTTDKGKRIMARCDHFDGYKLSNVYTSCSLQKQSIFDKWEEIYFDMGGATGFRICSHNSHVFTLGWYVTIDNKLATVYITPSHNYIVL